MIYWLISWRETTVHKFWVFWYMLKACQVLLKRALVHDLSKYGANEAPYFGKVANLSWHTTYGSEEYKRQRRELLQTALKHHYANNSHHPEFYERGIAEMCPLDQIEMLCDWKAATRRHADGSMVASLKHNAERFDISYEQHLGLLMATREIGLY